MTHYQALELPETATAADIRGAYRRLVLLTHPDRTPDPTAHARYLAINAAYEVLSAPDRRAMYDAVLHQPEMQETPVAPTGPRAPYRTTAKPSPTKSASYTIYVPLARQVCKCLFAFSLLLVLDRLIVFTLPQERVLASDLYRSKYGSYYRTETPNTSFSGQGFQVGDTLQVSRTAIFRQVVAVSYETTSTNGSEDEYTDFSFLYTGAGMLFLIALFFTSLAGAWPSSPSRRPIDCATMGLLLAIIILTLLGIS
jgi:curved DNA-binding protein CbpA